MEVLLFPFDGVTACDALGPFDALGKVSVAFRGVSAVRAGFVGDDPIGP